MKKILSLLMVLVFGSALVGCNSDDDNNTEPTIDDLRKATSSDEELNNLLNAVEDLLDEETE